MSKPNSYTPEFRESAVKLALDSDQPIAETAREVGVNENTLHTWIRVTKRTKRGQRKGDAFIFSLLPGDPDLAVPP